MVAANPAMLLNGVVLVGPAADGSAGQVLATDGSGRVSFANAVVIGGAIGGGAGNRVLYENSSNLLAESANFTFDGDSVVLRGSNALRLRLDANAAQTANILESYNAAAALRARITSAGGFSNTHGQSNGEGFGEGAIVNGVGGSSFGGGAVASTDAVAMGQGASANANSAIAIGHDASVSSTSGIAIGVDASAAGSSIALGRGATNTAGNQLMIGSGTTAIDLVFVGNGERNSIPVDTLFSPSSGLGTNISGGDLTLVAGRSTGTGTPGSLILQAAVADAGSGTTLNGLSTGFELTASTIALQLAFFGSAPVIRHATTGEATGFTAGTGTGVNDDSTFTGSVGVTAYRISDIVKALKNYGLMAG